MTFSKKKIYSFILFNELYRFLVEIGTDNLTVSNGAITTFQFIVSKIGFSWKSLVYL